MSLVVHYEHPDWFRPLFNALDRRGIAYARRHSDTNVFNPGETRDEATAALGGDVIFNRMSPSAWKRGRPGAIAETTQLLRHWDLLELPLINGVRAFAYETSKALQISLLSRLGLPYPKTRVVNAPAQLLDAARDRDLAFPLVVKPNIGGSGAGIVKYDEYEALHADVTAGKVPPSLDHVWLVQEYHAPEASRITRVETLDHRYLYGIHVHLGEGAGFDLCPADICKSTSGQDLVSAACPVDARKTALSVTAHRAPRDVIDAVERIAGAAGLDVGGVEYLDSARDGNRYYYDVNALSNFVADPVTVLGFDPTETLVDSLERRLRAIGGPR